MSYDDEAHQKSREQREQLRGPMPELKRIEFDAAEHEKVMDEIRMTLDFLEERLGQESEVAMTSINKGYCCGCGAPVGPDDYDEIGHVRLWTCGCRESLQEMRDCGREQDAQAREDAERDDYERYR